MILATVTKTVFCQTVNRAGTSQSTGRVPIGVKGAMPGSLTAHTTAEAVANVY